MAILDTMTAWRPGLSLMMTSLIYGWTNTCLLFCCRSAPGVLQYFLRSNPRLRVCLCVTLPLFCPQFAMPRLGNRESSE
jgi:hypothetical protein